MSTESLERFGYQQELARRVGYADLVFYGLVFMVPIAPFAIFGTVFSVSGGMPVLAYVVGMVALLFTATSYGQMVKAFPLSGSVYSYTGRGIAAPVGFLSGWAIFLDYMLVPSLLYLVAAIAMNATISAVPVWAWLVGFVIINTLINLRGIRMTANFTRVMLIGELVVLALFLAVGIWALANGKGSGWSIAPVFNSDTFAWPIIFGAVSVAVLSFLGFDGISMLVEESKVGADQVGRAMRWALILAGVLFIVQVWVAGLLVTDPQALIDQGDPNGTAFYDGAAVAGGEWLRQVTSVATAISWGIANTLVAQVAVARLLFAMARDRQLPGFLAQVTKGRSVPANATLLVAALSTGLGLWMATRDDGITLLASLINMGAMVAFIMLHLAVIVHYVVRGGSRDIWRHVLTPVIGIAILGYVVYSANVLAQVVGLIWLAAGLVVMAVLFAVKRGRMLKEAQQ
ncbi:MAG TPA: APC family permease [Candidatus Limnocylindrales bacterium]|nr:APC family permease [Candidatus Limnocylindrales bacterium]